MTSVIYLAQTYSYSTQSLHSFVLLLFERYAMMLEKQFSKRFKDVSILFVSNFIIYIYCSVFRLWSKTTICLCMLTQQWRKMLYLRWYG